MGNLSANRLNYSIKDNKLLAKANNEFTFKLFNKLDKPQEGITLFSPLSISSAMAMVGSGASGDTETELLNLLSIKSGYLLGGPYGSYLSGMNYNEPRLSIANALVLKDFNKVFQSYKDVIKLDYKGEVFKGDLEIINKWASDKTEGMIPKILENLDDDFACVILNAVYFKGEWQSPFEPEDTGDLPFNISASKVVQVPTMNQYGSFPLFIGDRYKAILLPYKGGNVSMVIALPSEGNEVKELIQELSEGGFGNFWKEISMINPERVNLSLPKFRIQSDYDLVSPFQSLGFKDAFTGNADFSKISGEGLLIDQIKHKAVVEVDEVGTVATGVTAISMMASGMPQQPIPFKVDRPFVFFLVDDKTGAILFLGRVSDPRG
jgi:serpin B